MSRSARYTDTILWNLDDVHAAIREDVVNVGDDKTGARDSEVTEGLKEQERERSSAMKRAVFDRRAGNVPEEMGHSRPIQISKYTILHTYNMRK